MGRDSGRLRPIDDDKTAVNEDLLPVTYGTPSGRTATNDPELLHVHPVKGNRVATQRRRPADQVRRLTLLLEPCLTHRLLTGERLVRGLALHSRVTQPSAATALPHPLARLR